MPRSTPPRRIEYDEPLATATDLRGQMRVVVVEQDGNLALAELHVTYAAPMPVERLATAFDVQALVRFVVAREDVQRERSPRAFFDLVDDSAAYEDAMRDAMKAYRSRNRVTITDDFLRKVVAWHEEGGPTKVKTETGCSERTLRRWLADARERGMR